MPAPDGFAHIPSPQLSLRLDSIFNIDRERVAVCAGRALLTYGGLCDSVDRLAQRLATEGVADETLVAICLPRSFDRIIAMLAVWVAGGAVLACDPAWPIERTVGLLDDSGARFVFAEEALLPKPADGSWILVKGCTNGPVDCQESMRQFAITAPDNRLAYVVYTSGSTGKPKGVEITHGNLNHLIAWHQAAFHLTSHDRVSHVAGLGFDAAFWEIVPALCAGATLVLAEEHVRASAPLMRNWLIDQGVTVAFVPTVLADIVIAEEWPQDCSLRIMLTGGETLHGLPRVGLPFVLVNNYGPSECTVVATSGRIDPGDASKGAPDIGRAIAGTHIHLLDGACNPVADGEAGEIFIGGGGVGRGYRNQPDLTALYFVADRFSATPGGKLYRTGDFARSLPDGRILFLGRRDLQEQIRGNRVEPAEVTATLGQHPMVRWCTVLGDGPAHNRRLVAYVLPICGTEPSSEALRAFLHARLAEPMIPSVFVRVAQVPLSANGKFDREALPAITEALPRAGYRAPATPAQSRLASIIGGLLGGVAVGADDNFFLLGGHSLLGTQVVLRAQEAFGIMLPLRDLFQAPTVALLADRITELLAAKLEAMTDDEADILAAS